MLLMITLAVVLMLIFYKPEHNIEGFIDISDSRWVNAPTCNSPGQCGNGLLCIKQNGLRRGSSWGGSSGKCLSCTNANEVGLSNTPLCNNGPNTTNCKACEVA